MEIKPTIKFKQWSEYFFNKENKETYGNATKSAMKAYKVGSYHSASQIGYENMRKLEYLKVSIAESEGLNIREFMNIAIEKAKLGTYSDWEKLGIQLGYFDNLKKPVIAAVQNNFDFSNLASTLIKARIERGLPV